MAARPRNGQQRQQLEDDDETAGFSDDQRNEIIDLVNAAVGTHIKRKLPQIVSGALEKPLGEIRALIENGGSGRQARREDDDPDIEPDEPDEPPARRGARDRGAVPTRQDARGRREEQPASRRGGDPEVAKLQAKMARMEQEREAERTAARNSERDGMLREMLTSAGVDKNRLRGAVAVLRDSMRFDDKTREWAFVAKRDGLDEELDPDVGIKEWAATDEGKSYLAPPGSSVGGATGAGASGVQRRSGAGTRVTGGARGGTAPVADAKTAKTQQVAQAQQTLATAIDALSGGIVPLG